MNESEIKKKIIKSSGITIITLLLALQLYNNADAQSKTVSLAKSRYSDSNGFFKIVPPEAWRIQKYPQDPRGKVAFIGPNGAELRVLGKALVTIVLKKC